VDRGACSVHDLSSCSPFAGQRIHLPHPYRGTSLMRNSPPLCGYLGSKGF